jgi:hypothetical protein
MPVLGFYIQGDFGISAVLGEERDASATFLTYSAWSGLLIITIYEIPTAFTG